MSAPRKKGGGGVERGAVLKKPEARVKGQDGRKKNGYPAQKRDRGDWQLEERKRRGSKRQCAWSKKKQTCRQKNIH